MSTTSVEQKGDDQLSGEQPSGKITYSAIMEQKISSM